MKSRFIPPSRLRMRCARRVVQSAILLSAAATVAGAQWNEIGSSLPRTTPAVRSLAIDPATPSTLYAIDWDGRLFKSMDSGGTWKVRGSVTGVSFVAVDPTNSSIIYAATQRGVLKSIDAGETWAGADSGLAGNLYALTIAIDPLTPATLYATTTQGLFKSTDAAQSWNKLDTDPSGTDYYFGGGITIDPITPSTIYLAYDGGPFNQGILKSSDGGQNWNSLDTPSGVSPYGLVIDLVTPSNLYALSQHADGNIFTSMNGGQSWIAHPIVPTGTAVLSLAIDPESPSTVYAVRFYGPGWEILKSVDSGENWSVLDSGPPPFPDPGGTNFLLAVSPTSPSTVYTGYSYRELPSGHLAKSTDGGVTWNAVDAGLTFVDVRAVGIDPVKPSTIYAGMSGSPSAIPVFRSADGGATWNSFAQFELSYPSWYSWINNLLVDPANANVIYAVANGDNNYSAVFNTTDGGANWTGTYSFAGIERVESTTVMALDAADSKTIYLGDYDGEGARLFKSTDGASTWTDCFSWDIGPVNALVTDPGNPAALYVGTPEGVFQSTDGGASWSNIGLSMGVSALALDPGDPNTIYAAAGGATYFSSGFQSLFKSTDGGANWTPINIGLDRVLASRSTVTALAFAPGDSNTVYVATSGSGVYKSLDAGANWVPLNKGLANLDVRLLAITSNALYAVTSGGIFQAIDASEPTRRPPR